MNEAAARLYGSTRTEVLNANFSGLGASGTAKALDCLAQNRCLAGCDRDMLLRELDHRVRNNLQFLNSLVNIEATQAREGGLKRIQDRIEILAEVYDTARGTGENGYLSAERLFRDLARIPARLARVQGLKMALDIEEGLSFRLDQALSIGLLFQCAIRSALDRMPVEAGLAIGIMGRTEGKFVILEIRDNMPRSAGGHEGPDLIVMAAAAQISADIEVEDMPIGLGRLYRISIPLNLHLALA